MHLRSSTLRGVSLCWRFDHLNSEVLVAVLRGSSRSLASLNLIGFTLTFQKYIIVELKGTSLIDLLLEIYLQWFCRLTIIYMASPFVSPWLRIFLPC